MAVIPLFTTSAFADNTTQKLPQLSSSDNFACKAFLCFAGGMHTPECQSTIRKVTRDLARGKSFPVCPMVANADGTLGGQNGSPKIWTQSSRRYVSVYVQDAKGDARRVAKIKKR